MVADLDDYSAIMLKALAIDCQILLQNIFINIYVRIIGAMKCRTSLIMKLSLMKRIKELVLGTGYPACPDHSQKQILFSWLDVPNLLVFI